MIRKIFPGKLRRATKWYQPHTYISHALVDGASSVPAKRQAMIVETNPFTGCESELTKSRPCPKNAAGNGVDMRNSIFAIATALALVGCGDGPPTNDDTINTSEMHSQVSESSAQMKLADIDLMNLGDTTDIAQKLAPTDAPLFLEYVISWKAAKVSGDQSKILRPDGAVPVTVADAIELTKAVQAKNADRQ